jgi:hypothetical protein
MVCALITKQIIIATPQDHSLIASDISALTIATSR